MYWDHLSATQLGEVSKKLPVILPVAATEQHGAHLPLATDRMIGEHFCRQLHQTIPQQVLILPSLAVGCSDHHLDFPGSLSLGHTSFQMYVEDVLSSVVHHGFSNLIIFNSHGGNQGIGQVIMESFGYENKTVKLVLITWWRLVLNALSELSTTGPGGVGHAGEFETSLMLHIAPDLVQMDRIEPMANEASYPWAEGDMIRGANAGLYRTMKEMTPNGVYGDPKAANPEKGEQITTLVVDRLREVALDLAGSP